METYATKRDRLARDMRQAQGAIRLEKKTTNLFRARREVPGRKLNVRDFNSVILVNPNEQRVDVEGMTSYEKLVDECLKFHVMPAVVPELKSITIGGAVSGTGLESSSFRYGFVHETVSEMDILLPDGRVITCTSDNEYKDLFFCIPNSYGTLGYILKLKAKTIAVKPYVHIVHTHASDTRQFFSATKEQCKKGDANFVEGVVLGEKSLVLSVARFSDTAPYTSDYTYRHIYYKSLLGRAEDYLTVRDYIWRWDTDWFWRSDIVMAQNPLVRLLLGKKHLNSIFYTKVMHWNRKWRIFNKVRAFRKKKSETVIQDVEIPIDDAAKFLEFLHREIQMLPIIIGPVIGSPVGIARFPLFPLEPHILYVNIGFWNAIPAREGEEIGYLNKLIEAKVTELNGRKMLYSDSYFTQEEFWKLYGGKDTYDRLKQKYDPERKLKNLYEKCVLRA